MAWYDFILDTGKQFFKPQNLLNSLGTAGIMQLFGGDSDDFKRNFLLSNLSRSSNPLSLSAKDKKKAFAKLSPKEKQEYTNLGRSGTLKKEDFQTFKDLGVIKPGAFNTYEDYLQYFQMQQAPSAGQDLPDFTPTGEPKLMYASMGGGYNQPSQQISTTSYKGFSDPAGILSLPQSQATSGRSSPDYEITPGPRGTHMYYDPKSGEKFILGKDDSINMITEGTPPAPGFGQGGFNFNQGIGGLNQGFFGPHLQNFDQIMMNKLLLEAINPDYYKKRDFAAEAEERDKRLRREFRAESLDPMMSGFARNMRPRGYSSGGITDLTDGGESAGPGTGTSDSIPALLSDGEFVMTAEAVRNMGNGSREKGTRKMYDLMNSLERKA